MIEINLIPQDQRRKKIELPDISFLPFIGGTVGIVIAIHLVLVVWANMQVGAITRLQTQWQELKPQQDDSEMLKRQLIRLREKIGALDELTSGRIVWTEKLNGLSDAMIPGVWLNRLWLETKKEILEDTSETTSAEGRTEDTPEVITRKLLHMRGSVIAGSGEEAAIVGKFIRSLKDNTMFYYGIREIDTSSIQRSQLKESEVMDFELICAFR